MPDLPTESVILFLKQIPTFKNLQSLDLEKISKCLIPKFLEVGDRLFETGDLYKKAVFLLKKGKAELCYNGQSYFLSAGEFVGLANALDMSPYACTVTALTPLEILTIPIEGLHDIEYSCPILYNGLNRLIAGHLRDRSAERQVTHRSLLQTARAIMKSPVATCIPTISLRDAYEKMRMRKMSSMGVVDQQNNLLGLLTLTNIADAILIHGAQPETPIEVAYERPHIVKPDMPLWQVEEIQQDQNTKYVVVLEDNKPIGIISQTDILNTFITEQNFSNHITRATTFSELAAQKRQILSIASDAWDNNHYASIAVKMISEFHLAIQRRCIELTEQEMIADGLGQSPANYTFIIMGSGSRKEMLINPDQDNGIIIDDAPVMQTEQGKQWFSEFCQRVNTHLDEIGYMICTGEIMASHIAFRKTLSQWQQQISRVIHFPTKRSARWANIFLDFDTLYGDEELALCLRKHIETELSTNQQLLRLMVEDDAEGQPPLSWFNRLITERDKEGKAKIDIKRNGLRIIADITRIYALKYSINDRCTVDRLSALVRQGIFPADFIQSITVSFEELLDLLLDHQIQQLRNQSTVDKLIIPANLPPLHHESLRMAMLAIKRFQEKLQTEFDTLIF